MDGGIDSNLLVYSVDDGILMQFDFFGTTGYVKDLKFGGDDRLASLIHYLPEDGGWNLRIYDIPAIFSDFPNNAPGFNKDALINGFMWPLENTQTIELPVNDYERISVWYEIIKVYGDDVVLYEYTYN